MYCLSKLNGQNDVILVMLFRLAIILSAPFLMDSGGLIECINKNYYSDWCSQDTGIKTIVQISTQFRIEYLGESGLKSEEKNI